jgi:protein-S-isoprenylcysteine O-methyltransferase Ste14
MSIFILLVSLAVWGYVHSLLASHAAKAAMKLGRWHRLAYNTFALLTFAPILYLMRTLPDQAIYQVPAPWNILMFGGQLLAALMLLIAVLQTDILAFIGFRQLSDEQKPAKLTTNGLYRFVRHPLYTGILSFIWLTPTMTQNSLTVYLGATIYILIGAYFEEKKLVGEFGDAYTDYKRRTPMLIPGLMFRAG